MKRWICLMLCVISMLFAVPVYAVEERGAVASPKLTFTGTTAYCSFSISEIDKDIDVTMKLLEDGVTIQNWSKSGTDYVYLNNTLSDF